MTLTNSSAMEEEFEKYVNLSIQWNRWLLKPLGVWPYSSNISRIQRCCNWFLNTLCYSLISFLFVPCALYVMTDVQDVYNKIKLVGPLSFCMMAYLKYYSIISHGNDIRKCFERIETDWRIVKHSEDRDIMIENANFGKRLVKICAFFMYSGVVFYYIAIPIKVGKIKAEDENITFVPMMFPFSRLLGDTRYSPVNEILFSIQLLGGVLIHGISAGACSLIAVFAVHACGQMQVLICWLRYLKDGRIDMCKTVDGRIASIVSQHVRVLQFLSLTEKTLQQISLVEVSGCTLNLCLLGYYIIKETDSEDFTASVTYTVILISFVFNIFIFCYIGEILAELCGKVGDMSYMSDWYQLEGNRKRNFVLMIAMSKSSMKLTAGNMMDLSLGTFADVLGGILIHGISAAACSLLATLAVHTCGQMEVLMCWLRHLKDGRIDMCKTVDGRIASIVSQHVRALKFLALTEKTMQQISLVEVLGCTLQLCLLGFYIIKETDSENFTASVTYTVILTSFVFNIFIFCYIGEILAELCGKVGDMSYMSDWYQLKGNRKRNFVLIIAMSKSSMKLTAGNMMDLSLGTFADVVKTSVAYLNMLRTLT
ncbi:uncharacterized protein LOC143151681 [Ptiloglossa arizonensis]|uniref:uncharacterized protein LOC143151681 n=1 Tax=Ptiloglossa arizonensis TaxID=3350558 RepID=UPI003FA0ED26